MIDFSRRDREESPRTIAPDRAILGVYGRKARDIQRGADALRAVRFRDLRGAEGSDRARGAPARPKEEPQQTKVALVSNVCSMYSWLP